MEFAFEEFKYRMPYKSGGRAVDRVTLLNVTVEVISPSGKVTKIPGFEPSPFGTRKYPALALGRGWKQGPKSPDMTPMMRKLDGLSVRVDDVIYMPSLDAPDERPHPFVYFISIKNESGEKVTIRGRKWIVREDDGEVTVVEGDGVVGQTPVIGPGESFSYNSYHVTRGDAVAEGAFFGETGGGEWVFAPIPEFKLTVPGWV